MAYLGRRGALAPLTSADIPAGSVSAVKVASDVATQAELDSQRTNSSITTLGTVTAGNLANTALVYPAGHVIQTLSYNFSPSYQGTLSDWTVVTASGETFQLAITPSNSSNKILVTAVIQAGSDNWFGININRQVSGASDVVINVGSDTLGNKLASTFGSHNQASADNEETDTKAVIYLDNPATTLEVNYAVFAIGRYGSGSNHVSINRPYSWNDDAISGRVTASNIILQEIQQ
jgi:hypothetical protein